MRVPAHALFFPAGATYAALVLPASVAAMLGIGPALPGLAVPSGHAHELLFGFALAAVAGNQLGPVPRSTLALLFTMWLAARVAFVSAPSSVVSLLANALFAALLAWQLAPRLLASVRKLRNRALPMAVVAFCAAAVAIEAARHLGAARAEATVLLAGVLLIALLMLFMGGRIIAPSAAGQAYRQGGDLAARVQPRIEAALIAVMFVAVAAVSLAAHVVAGLALVAAAVLAAVRLARWQLWKLRRRPDIACLAAGYAWLALGLAAIGSALLAQARPATAIHVVTVGAMGTLTINVMALTWARLARRDPAREWLPVWATVLIALATLARVIAGLDTGDARTWLIVAASDWFAAYALLLVTFARLSLVRASRQAP